MKLFHSTTAKRAGEILPAEKGSRSPEFREEDGVVFTDKPDLNAEALLDLQIDEHEIAAYEQINEAKSVREWLIPARFLNIQVIDRVPHCFAEVIKEGVYKGVYFNNAPDVYGVEPCEQFAFNSECMENRVGRPKVSACDKHYTALKNAAGARKGRGRRR